MKQASLITDGSCLANPGGPGGWACILRFGTAKKELFGFEPATTNNRMELMAAIQGLLAFKEPCEVEITTDSQYVLQGATLWLAKWKRRHWWKKHRAIRNADLWIELDALLERHTTDWIWTKGHAAHEDNNRCDWLAQRAATMQTSSWNDGRPHATMLHNLGPAFVPPRPQMALFEDFGDDDDSDGAED